MNVTCIDACFFVCGVKNKFVRLDKKVHAIIVYI